MATASTNAVQPVAFDNADQVDTQLTRLEQRIEEHVQAAAQGKDKAFADQLRAILREVGHVQLQCHRLSACCFLIPVWLLLPQTVLGPLAGIVHDNVSVNGKTWVDYIQHTQQGEYDDFNDSFQY